MTSKKNTLTLDLRDHYSNGYAVIHATGDQYAGTHWTVAQVVVRMNDDEEDTPELVRFAHELVNRYNQHDELLAALQGMIDIASDSTGVAGYHRNGDIAEWDEFCEWNTACDVIAKVKGGAA